MRLRLYTTPHFDQTAPLKARLLFEAQPGTCSFRGRQVDFYLYVWIRNGECLQGFQAIVDNDFVLSYDAPGRVMLGRIASSPVNRTVVECQDALAIRDLQAVMNGMENDEFPGLMRKIADIANGLSVDDRLADAEVRICGDLLNQAIDKPPADEAFKPPAER